MMHCYQASTEPDDELLFEPGMLRQENILKHEEHVPPGTGLKNKATWYEMQLSCINVLTSNELNLLASQKM